MTNITFEGLDKNQTEVVSQIGAGNDKGHSISVVADLLSLGYIEATDDGGYQMFVTAHMRWCQWCSDNLPPEYL